MKHTFLLFLILLGVAQMAYSQVNPIVAKAAELCDEKKYEEALAQIDEGFKLASLNSDPNAWFVKGFILKELYKIRSDILTSSLSHLYNTLSESPAGSVFSVDALGF